MLCVGEGTNDSNGFRRLVGGGEFESFAMHPAENLQEFPPGGPRSFKAGGFYQASRDSTAAGKWQIIYTTWKKLRQKYPGRFPDFSPESQRAAAIELIRGRGALADIEACRFDAAVAKCNREWASLPGAPYGQRTVSLAQVRTLFQTNGGTIA